MQQQHTSTATPLQLDRRLQNHTFESWKIGSSFVASRTASQLPAPVYQGAADAVDFAHTAAALLCNHLFASAGRLFTITAAAADATGLAVHEVTVQQEQQQGEARALVRHVADVPTAAATAAEVTPTDAALHCSIAVLATPQAEPAAAASGDFQALVSSGKGDLQLLTSSPTQPGRVSAPVFPLRPRPPAVGTKPFSIAAAWETPAGRLRAVLWCLTDTTATHNSSSSAGQQQHHRAGGQSAWVSETWLVTLSAQDVTPPGAQQQLQVLDCQLLLVSQALPAAAVACAAADKLLLVAEPGLEEGELPAGYKQQLAAAMGLADQQQQQQPDSSAMETDPSAAAAAAAAGDGGQTAGGAGMDEDGDDVDPRTLAAAVARLAKFTSENQVGDLPQQQWSDVFKESGPGELGTGGSEPAVDILLYAPVDAPSSSGYGPLSAATGAATATGAAGAGMHVTAGRFSLKCTASCGPHKLLSAESFTGSSSELGGLLLGLTDDVDCAVVTAAFSNPAAAAAAAAAGGSSSGSSGSSSGDLVVTHSAFLPAIAYVVAGKTQRRHFLLAPAGDSQSPICCALVEGRKYSYLYGRVPAGSSYGQQQIVDMELPEGQSVLGARLVHVNGGGSSGAASGTVLLLLTQSQLVCYQLKAPV